MVRFLALLAAMLVLPVASAAPPTLSDVMCETLGGPGCASSAEAWSEFCYTTFQEGELCDIVAANAGNPFHDVGPAADGAEMTAWRALVDACEATLGGLECVVLDDLTDPPV